MPKGPNGQRRPGDVIDKVGDSALYREQTGRQIAGAAFVRL